MDSPVNTQTDLLAQGVDLMLYGMGTVFVFLTVLVLATTLMSWLTQRFFAEPETPAAPLSPAPAPADRQRLLAVLRAAVAEYRRHRH